MYYVYLIKSVIKKFIYIGYTSDLQNRFKEHGQGQVKSTKAYKLFELVYYEAHKDKTTALKRKYELKNNSQQKEILLERLFSTKNGPVV